MAYPDAQRPAVRPESAALRVSDADRDAVATELSQHFQDGRLDQAEFDERLTAAMSAKRRSDLDGLLADLPRQRPGDGTTRSAALGHPGWPRALAFLPLLAAVFVIASFTGGWHHGPAGWPFAPWLIGWLIIAVAVRMRLRSRRRQWR